MPLHDVMLNYDTEFTDKHHVQDTKNSFQSKVYVTEPLFFF